MTTTVSCAVCGTPAEPGQSFCDGCGAVLSWREGAGPGASAQAGTAGEAGAGSRAGTAGQAGAGAEARAAGQPGAGAQSGAAGQASAGAQSGAAGQAAPDAAAGAAADSRGAAPADATETAPTEQLPEARDRMPATDTPGGHREADRTGGDPGPAPADEDSAGLDRARRLLVPVAEPEPAPAGPPPSVAPVLPGRPTPQRPQAVRAPGAEYGADGGVTCPWCATPNHPDRHFCVRCAMPMTKQEQAAVHRPWWRRMAGLRNRETPWAGDRPRLRRTFDRVLSWLGAAVALTLLVLLVANVPRAVQSTKDHFAKRSTVAPDSYRASRSFPGHPAGAAFDKWNNTWWGPGVSETGQGQWIEATFDQPTRLLDLIITSGVSTHPDQLQREALPHRIKATITTAKGTRFTRELILDQTSGGQRLPFRVGTVTRVRFTVESAYFASPAKQVAIAEIEFFGPATRH